MKNPRNNTHSADSVEARKSENHRHVSDSLLFTVSHALEPIIIPWGTQEGNWLQNQVNWSPRTNTRFIPSLSTTRTNIGSRNIISDIRSEQVSVKPSTRGRTVTLHPEKKSRFKCQPRFDEREREGSIRGLAFRKTWLFLQTTLALQTLNKVFEKLTSGTLFCAEAFAIEFISIRRSKCHEAWPICQSIIGIKNPLHRSCRQGFVKHFASGTQLEILVCNIERIRQQMFWWFIRYGCLGVKNQLPV